MPALDGLSFDYDSITAVGVLIAIAILVITDRLVWHTRLHAAEARADRWESIALEALTMSANVSVKAAEVSSEVLAHLPDPTGRGAST